MFGLHPIDLIVVLIIALLVFGPKKLPEMGSAIGKSIKEFRKGMNELSNPTPTEAALKPAIKETYEEKIPVAVSADAEKVTSVAPGGTVIDSEKVAD